MDTQDNFPQQVSSLEALVSLRRVGERVFRRDRNLQVCLLDGSIQPLILPRPRNGIVCGRGDTGPRFRGPDAIGIRHPSAGLERIDATLEALTVGKAQHRIYSVRREVASGPYNIAGPPIDYEIGPQLFYEGRPVFPGSGGQHSRAAQLRELDCETSHSARGSMDDDCLSRLQV